MQFTTTKELAAAISPRLKPSYSPNLHKWVKYWAKTHPEHILPEVWLENDDLKLLRIGFQSREKSERMDCGFIGVRLNAVLCNGTSANKERGWFTDLGPGNMTHITDFWERYLQIGRCAIDTEHSKHFLESEGRYVMDGDVRTCTWCGAQHKRRIKTITEEIEYFDPVAP